MELKVTAASQMIKQSNIALTKTGCKNPFYLLKLSCDPFINESTITDNHNHVFQQIIVLLKATN